MFIGMFGAVTVPLIMQKIMFTKKILNLVNNHFARWFIWTDISFALETEKSQSQRINYTYRFSRYLMFFSFSARAPMTAASARAARAPALESPRPRADARVKRHTNEPMKHRVQQTPHVLANHINPKLNENDKCGLSKIKWNM